MSADGEMAEGDADEELSRLRGEVDVLQEENRRLREEVARARQARYRRTAVALGALGVVAAGGGVLFPDVRDVLFSLAAIGLFSGFLVYYLTPEAVITADVGERVYEATARNLAAIVDELGLREESRYVPTADGAYLFVPQAADAGVPDVEEGPIVTREGARGLFVVSTGTTLFAAFEEALTAPLADGPRPLAVQLADGLVEQFELARSVDTDAEAGRVTFEVDGSAFGDVDRLDHPIAAFFAVGMAAGLEDVIELEVQAGDAYADWLVTCRWED